jgi:hypothetical protein
MSGDGAPILCITVQLRLAHCGVGFHRHICQYVEEFLALADKESIGGETLDRGHSTSECIGQRTNDRDMGKAGTEFDRNGEDQAGLNLLIQWAEKVGKCQAGDGVRKWRDGSLHSVARKIDPFQKVSDLVPTNAKGDLQHFRIRHFLTHGCVKAGAALLNVSEVKGSYIGDRLNVIVALKVFVVFARE